MKIVVLVKQVPDTFGERKLDTTTGLLDRDASEPIIDEINERALEAALQQKDADKSVEVVALSMGPSSATDALRKALAMGADRAIHVLDDSLAGADVARTTAVIGAAVASEGFDLVVAGNESTDGRGGVLASSLAETLGVAALTSIGELTVDGTSVSGVRATEYGTVTARADLPAVVSATERAPEGRFPNFKGIMTAKKKPLATVTLAELGVGDSGARSTVVSVAERPARTAGVKIVDDGTAATQLAEFLASNRLI
ncbi:MAG: electron transfer flavoprotein subunit beta/FixA family protein [Cryobacterium sp.]|nr:electron transfer flavoprotein subunit beta/FixA family protein [Cryobacterium sp.]